MFRVVEVIFYSIAFSISYIHIHTYIDTLLNANPSHTCKMRAHTDVYIDVCV